MKKKIHIAIIDDAIDESRVGMTLQNRIGIEGKAISAQSITDPEEITHGTVCFGIMSQYVSDISVSSICILGKDRKGSAESLYTALEWCCENGVDIANISLGSNSYKDRDEMKRKMNSFAKKGLILICAADNTGVWTYPASLANVIGVKGGKTDSDTWKVVDQQKRYDGVEVEANSFHRFSWKDGRQYDCDGANSYAAPYITAKLAAEMQIRPIKGIMNARKWLYSQGLNQNQHEFRWHNLDWIDLAICVWYGRNDNRTNLPFDFAVEHIMIQDPDAIFDWKERFNIADAVIIFSSIPMKKTNAVKLKRLVQGSGVPIIFADDFNLHYNIDILGREGLYTYDPRLDYSALQIGRAGVQKDIPVVQICSDKIEQLMQTGKILQRHFENEGYCPLICSQLIQAVFCGYIHINYNLSNTVLKALAEIHMADICIVLSEKQEKNVDTDVIVQMEEEENVSAQICWEANRYRIYAGKAKSIEEKLFLCLLEIL